MSGLAFQRILLKVSGEALMGEQGFGIDPTIVERICTDISKARALGASIAIVVGGGNIFRGVSVAAKGGDRVTGDHMGMLATVMNCLALKNALEDKKIPVSVFSGLAMPAVCEPFTQRDAIAALESGKVVLFGGGTGNPYFTTDTGAALRAAEMKCDALFKATQVDGIYSDDPKKNPTATRYEQLTHQEVLEKGLAVMDAAAVALAQDNQIPVVVFSIHEDNQLIEVLQGKGRKTIVAG